MLIFMLLIFRPGRLRWAFTCVYIFMVYEHFFYIENNEEIEECRCITTPVEKLRWSERQTISHEKWEEC